MAATQSKQERPNTDPDRAEEARNLAQDAAEAKRHGDKEEAEFLMKAAKDLDPKVSATKE